VLCGTSVGSDMHPVNNLRIRNFIRDTYKQDSSGVNDWIQLWNRFGFEAIETMLRGDKTRRGSATVPVHHCRRLFVSQVFSAVRFKTDNVALSEIRAIIETCTALKPFADAHPSLQPDAQN